MFPIIDWLINCIDTGIDLLWNETTHSKLVPELYESSKWPTCNAATIWCIQFLLQYNKVLYVINIIQCDISIRKALSIWLLVFSFYNNVSKTFDGLLFMVINSPSMWRNNFAIYKDDLFMKWRWFSWSFVWIRRRMLLT